MHGAGHRIRKPAATTKVTGFLHEIPGSFRPRLTATRAATLQLTVPVLAALGGGLFLQETISPRLVLASLLVLGGGTLAIFRHRRG